MKNPEYKKFDDAMRKLVSVPHDKIKAKLEAEKKAKKRKVKNDNRNQNNR